MNKAILKRSLTVLFVILLSFSSMIILNVKAQESVTPEQALTLLTQISNLDTTKYTPEPKNHQSNNPNYNNGLNVLGLPKFL